MKILKEGNIDVINKVKRFECTNCGCIFEATKDEYKIGSQYNTTYYTCECPFCHEIAGSVRIREGDYI